MPWSPVAGLVPQYQKSDGTLASGYYLKFYQEGTTTPFSMATDDTGGTLLAKCALNSSGEPINGSSDPFIPHVDQDYKPVLYKNATDADNNTIASAQWNVDVVPRMTMANEISSNLKISNSIILFETVAAMVASTGLSVGDHVKTLGYLSLGDGGGNEYDVVASGTGTADGGEYIDLATHQAKGLFVDSNNSVKQWGANDDGTTTDDTTAFQNAMNKSSTSGMPLIIPKTVNGFYLESQLALPSNLSVFGYGYNSLVLCKTNVAETYFFRADSKENILLQDFRIRSDSTNGNRAFVRHVGFNYATNNKVNGVFYNDCTNVKCIGLYGEFLNRGLQTESCRDIIMNDNIVKYCENRAMSHNQSNRIEIISNFLYMCGQSMGLGFPNSSDLVVNGNFIWNPEYTGINPGGADDLNARGIEIVGNTVCGQDVVNLEKGAIDANISGNLIYVAADAATNGNGISVLNNQNNDFSAEITINGNKIRALGYSSIVSSSSGSTITTTTSHNLTTSDHVYFLDTNLPDIEGRLVQVISTPTATTFTTSYTPASSLTGIVVSMDGSSLKYANGIFVSASFASSKGKNVSITSNNIVDAKSAGTVSGNTSELMDGFLVANNYAFCEDGFSIARCKNGKISGNYFQNSSPSMTSGDHGFDMLGSLTNVVFEGNTTQGFSDHYFFDSGASCTNVLIRPAMMFNHPGGGGNSNSLTTNSIANPPFMFFIAEAGTARPNQTISGGAITCISDKMEIDTEGSAPTDDLDTINAGSAPIGLMIRIQALSSTRTVVVKDNTGNIQASADFTMDHENDRMMLDYNGSNFIELARSDNDT